MERDDLDFKNAASNDAIERPVYAPPPFQRTAQHNAGANKKDEKPVNKLTVAVLCPLWVPLYLVARALQVFVLMFEVLLELLYLSTPRYRSLRRSATTKELPLPVSEPRGSFQPIGSYPAIVVDSVSLDNIKAGVRVADLPAEIIQLPVDDISKVAVLSWKWDFDHEQRSKNLASVIKYARSVGIKYVFVDIVSIEQKGAPDSLISHVVAFSSLYKIIPVLAVYDHKDMELREIMLRPWIHKEIKLSMETSTKLVYIGHNQQGTSVSYSMFEKWLGRPPKSQLRRTCFAKELRDCWNCIASESLLFVLNGTTGMTNIHDFKYIVPGFSCAFTKAEALSRNDYLLTVLLLISAAYSTGRPYYHRMDNYFLGLDYTKYRFEFQKTTIFHDTKAEYGNTLGSKHEEYECIHTVFLGTRAVGTFTYNTLCKPNGHLEKNISSGFKLQILPDTEESILDMLQLSISERELYESQKNQRQPILDPPTKRLYETYPVVRRPGMAHIDVVSIKL